MTLNVSLVWQTILATLRDPDAVAAQLLSLNLSSKAVWHLFGLTIIASVMMFYGTELLLPTGLGQVIPPFTLVVMMTANLSVLSFAMLGTGRALEGNARLDQIVLVLSWMQVMLIALQIPQSVLSLAIPSLGDVFSLMVVFYALWLTVRFVKVAHGFETLGRAIASVVLAFTGITLGLVVLMSLLGV
ncbi:YIP1 family protein [Donghicola mangrovi]|uniref:Yip1 domain-containing protein n=1 Tax=Donghicola mangrovi TaxID=2729614 RepID=A0A850QBE0_9RHOB|nr:YIP1 family protein [Donghicola mangrovi]NVO23765.1 hypothetical protein [Donghicola mangrovi]